MAPADLILRTPTFGRLLRKRLMDAIDIRVKRVGKYL